MANSNRKYYSQIYNNSNLEYRQAQEYYAGLKKDMTNIIRQNFLQRLGQEADQAIDNYANAIIDAILGKSSIQNDYQDSKDTATSQLDEAFQKATQTAANTSASTKEKMISIFEQVKKEMDDYQKKQKEKEGKEKYQFQNYTRSFLERVDTKLKKEGYGDGWLQAQRKNYKTSLVNIGTSEEIANQLSSYYLREFINQIQKETIVVGKEKFIQVLRGYHLEEARANAINKGIDQLMSNLSKDKGNQEYQFAINIGGQNTKQDIKFDLSFGLLDAQKITAEGLSSVGIKEEDIKKLLVNEIANYGAQVKSWLPNSKDGWQREALPIGYRADLYNTFKNLGNIYPFNQITASMVYLGQEDNIKEALGRDNVMFIDGKNYYWMEDFIKKFRRARYYLSFDYKDKKEPTQDVILYQWYKHHKDKYKKNEKS